MNQCGIILAKTVRLRVFVVVIILMMVYSWFYPTKTEVTNFSMLPWLSAVQMLRYVDTNIHSKTTGADIDSSSSPSIQIVVVVEKSSNVDYYKHAIDSLKCYTQIQNYTFLLVNDSSFSAQCPHRDKFFRRHCVAAQLLYRTDYTLFLDADIGVVNPRRKIEEFIDDRFDITFYDRFYNFEVMAGAYLVKNTQWSKTFLEGWADFEYNLFQKVHGTDNGALHAFLPLVLFPEGKEQYTNCFKLYAISIDYDDLFAFEACIRTYMEITERFGKVRILKKGTGWARDNWLTNSKWTPQRDFMMHGWKLNQLTTYNYDQLPLTIQETSRSSWYNPLAGTINLSKCNPLNDTWSYDANLITTVDLIEEELARIFDKVENSRFGLLSRVAERLNL